MGEQIEHVKKDLVTEPGVCHITLSPSAPGFFLSLLKRVRLGE